MILIAVAHRADAQDQQGQRPIVHPELGRVGGLVQRRVGKPPRSRRTARQNADVQQDSADWHHPIPEGVQSRESHVARAHLQRDDIIRQAEEHRHHDEKDHRRAVHGEQLIEGIRGDQLVVRDRQLQPDEKRLESGNHEEDQPREHVENPPSLVIHRGNPRDAPVHLLLEREHRRMGRGGTAEG